MNLKLYGLRKCSTCQKAMAWLDGERISYSFTDYSQQPLDKAQVAGWSKALGGWEKMINRAGYTWRGLPKTQTANLTEAAAIALALKYPSLIRRPLIEYTDGSVTVGFADKVRKQIAGM
jgi:Spx/MgsR family transcriptional regulator